MRQLPARLIGKGIGRGQRPPIGYAQPGFCSFARAALGVPQLSHTRPAAPPAGSPASGAACGARAAAAPDRSDPSDPSDRSDPSDSERPRPASRAPAPSRGPRSPSSKKPPEKAPAPERRPSWPALACPTQSLRQSRPRACPIHGHLSAGVRPSCRSIPRPGSRLPASYASAWTYSGQAGHIGSRTRLSSSRANTLMGKPPGAAGRSSGIVPPKRRLPLRGHTRRPTRAKDKHRPVRRRPQAGPRTATLLLVELRNP